MATQTITISSKTPVQLLTSANKEISTVANLDAVNTVYLGSDPSGQAGAFPLTAGSVVSWDKERALYAYVNTTPVQIVILDNGGSFNNGVAVANALMSSGLAQAIATDIAASNLAANTAAQTAVQIAASTLAADTANHVSASTLAADTAALIAASALAANTAAQINATGVPSIDQPVLLTTFALVDGGYLPAINVAKYQSVTITISSTAGADRIAIAAFQGAGGGTRQYEFSTVANGFSTLSVPAVGDTLHVYLPAYGAFTGIAYVYGSLRSVEKISWTGEIGNPASYYNGIGWGGGTLINTKDFLSYGSSSAGSNGGPFDAASMQSGRAHLTAMHRGSAGTFVINVTDTISGLDLVTTQNLSPGQSFSYDFIVAKRPWRAWIQTASVVGLVELTISMEV
jgi:hypothetical protein